MSDVIDNQLLTPPDIDAHRSLVESHLAQTKLLLRAIETQNAAKTTFVFRAGVQQGTAARVTAANRGILQMIHNPTPAPLTVILSLNGNVETAILNLVVAANDAKGVTLPFSAPLYMHSGNGAILTGEAYA